MTIKRFRNPTLAVDGIVLLDDKLVLIQRKREPFKGSYALPGGFVNYGEKTEDAAVREVLEETGLRTRVKRLIGVYSDPNRDPRGHVVTIAYELEVLGGELRAGNDAKSVKRFPIDSLPKLAFDHDKIISDYRKLSELNK